MWFPGLRGTLGIAVAVACAATLFAAAPARASSLAKAPAAAKPAAKPVAKPAGKPAGKTGKASKSARPAVVLYQINRREVFNLRPTDERGRPVPGFQRKFDTFMRCHHSNKRHAMNPRLARLLYETGRKYPGRRLDVISGYRHPKFAKNPRSPHKKGLACDLRVEGVKNTELRDFFRSTFKKVGVGYYPNSSFVHLDVRQGPSAFWIDYSGPGETALYSKTPGEDLMTGRADRWKRTLIDPSWADSDDEAPAGGGEAPAVPGGPSPAGGPAPGPGPENEGEGESGDEGEPENASLDALSPAAAAATRTAATISHVSR